MPLLYMAGAATGEARKFIRARAASGTVDAAVTQPENMVVF